MRDEHPTDPDSETTEIRETRAKRPLPDDPESRNWVAYALIGFVVLLLLLTAWWLSRDDDEAENVRDVEVTQQDTDIEAEGERAEGDTGGATDSDDDGGDAAAQGGDTIIIERGDGGSESDVQASAEGGDVVTQRRPDGGAAEVNVTIAESGELEQFDDTRIRIPTGTELAVAFENNSNDAYNAYIELGAGGPELASIEPLVNANSKLQESFTTPEVGGDYTVRIEDQEGNTVLEATLVLEDR